MICLNAGDANSIYVTQIFELLLQFVIANLQVFLRRLVIYLVQNIKAS